MIAKILGYGVTLAIATAGGWVVWSQYQHYNNDPWTRDAQVRANVVGIAPRVPGPIIRVAVVDNQHVRRGDLLFEIDPADYRAAVAEARHRYRLQRQLQLRGSKTWIDRRRCIRKG